MGLLITGLPNRLLMKDRLHQAISQARRSGGAVALMFIDLDRFKMVNDSFGHITSLATRGKGADGMWLTADDVIAIAAYVASLDPTK